MDKQYASGQRRWSIGPGALVAAAFIGPGTVTTCTIAGASFGFALVWTLIFATVATMLLQEMAARLGVVTRRGLGDVLVSSIHHRWTRSAAIALVLAALLVGNAAYEAGNISGAALGLQAAFGSGIAFRVYIVIIASLAALLLLHGRYRLIERLLVTLVLVMCGAFLITAVLTRPDVGALLSGLRPSIPSGGLLTAIALIGTTVVPYNLFLHASAASDRWQGTHALSAARADTFFSVGLGGLISILILSTAAASLFIVGANVDNAIDMAAQLQPVFGPAAKWLIAIGLFAAGLSSAITAPMATAFAVCECFRLPAQTGSVAFRAIALAVLGIGAAIGSLGLKPVSVILFAQAANGLLLPIVAGFLLLAMNRPVLLGPHTNGPLRNLLGAAVVLVSLLLGLRLLWRVLG